MLKITVSKAENLPLISKKERKTTIYCFSTLYLTYFIDSFKNDEKTKNPKWNREIKVDMFRCGSLVFTLYGTQMLSHVFIGKVEINMSQFLLEGPGKEIFQEPFHQVNCSFPLTFCESSNAKLHLSFLYVPRNIPQVQYEHIKDPFVYVWVSLSPPMPNPSQFVEFELLQIVPDQDEKTKECLAYTLGQHHSWEQIGFYSSKLYHLANGIAPLAIINLMGNGYRYHFFIVNVPEGYSGNVRVNFLAERTQCFKSVRGQVYDVPSPDYGIFKTVDIKVEPNKKYSVPFYMYFSNTFVKKSQFGSFDLIETEIVPYHPEMDYIDQCKPYLL